MTMEEFTWVRVVLAISVHAVILCVAAWDLCAAATGHPTLSVSHLTQAWARENPVLPLAVGVVMGHLFWPIR
jgi:hypothetical protein